ncbi:MAG: hypothetical protein JXO72_01820 [Vicinamibacteria bacterium]|nr:hypothetical protein [Vicinamibacteria bacterium]
MRRSLVSTLILTVMGTACAPVVEVPIESPLRSRIDMRAFSRMLVGGFATEPSDIDIDVEGETIRLLQNQLRAQSRLRVFVIDRSPLQAEIARAAEAGIEGPADRERQIADVDAVLDDAAFWRRVGEEYQQPLIIAGKLGFVSHDQPGFRADERVVSDRYGMPRLVRGNRYAARKGFSLTAQFHFIDGRNGETMHKEKYTEEVFYGEEQKVSPLSSYFELMDRLLPNVLGVVSTRKIQSTRVLME